MEFTKKLQEQYKLSTESIALLQEHMQLLSFEKKEVIIQEGQRDDYTYFVESGSVRAYVIREDKQVTLFFAFEGDSATTILGPSNTLTSKLTIETLEPTTLVRISRTRLEELFRRSLEIANWGRKLMEKTLLEYEHYFIEYYWMEKSTQYQALMKEHPQLLQRVSLKEIASYLNITPQTLSRIRAHIKCKTGSAIALSTLAETSSTGKQ